MSRLDRVTSSKRKNNFSRREKQVLDLVLRGLPNKQIGKILRIREETVKYHLTSIYKISKTTSRSQLLVKAFSSVAFRRKAKLI